MSAKEYMKEKTEQIAFDLATEVILQKGCSWQMIQDFLIKKFESVLTDFVEQDRKEDCKKAFQAGMDYIEAVKFAKYAVDFDEWYQEYFNQKFKKDKP
jgi:hypothetical protein